MTTKMPKFPTGSFRRNCDRYEIISTLGRGKYSEVYEGIDNVSGKRVVIKILKPVRKVKISREITILQTLRSGTNIVDLLDVCLDRVTNTPSLIFEYISSSNLKTILNQLSLEDIQHYTFQILKAIDYCHSRGIMHRDIKPMNIIVDVNNKSLKLIDWGLSEFYIPNKDFNTRVSSRPYKSPELLIGYNYYDFSMDIWSTGCILAAMMFKKDHFFLGKDNNDQLLKIVQILGSNDFFNYLQKFNITVDASEMTLYKKYCK